MTGYVEVLQVIGATIIFSLILTTTNRYMLSHTQRQVGSEVEITAVTLGQDLIEESKLRFFDAAQTGGNVITNIPDDFAPAPFATATDTTRETIESFEGFNGFTEIITNGFGEFTISAEVNYVEPGNLNVITNSKTPHKRMTVTVTHESLNNPVSINYTRTFK